MSKYRKKTIKKMRKPYYVADEYGHTDESLVGKVNELVDIINQMQEEIADLRKLTHGHLRG